MASAASAPVTVREIEWTPAISQALDDPAARSCLSWLEREVRGGRSQLWECRSGAYLLHVVTRLDENPREWVFCYAHGTGIATFAAHFLSVADRKGWTIRTHTTAPAIVRMARRFGFAQSEYILRR